MDPDGAIPLARHLILGGLVDEAIELVEEALVHTPEDEDAQEIWAAVLAAIHRGATEGRGPSEYAFEMLQRFVSRELLYRLHDAMVAFVDDRAELSQHIRGAPSGSDRRARGARTGAGAWSSLGDRPRRWTGRRSGSADPARSARAGRPSTPGWSTGPTSGCRRSAGGTRATAQLRGQRPQLEALPREFEHDAWLLEREGAPTPDIDRLRTELGMEQWWEPATVSR